MEIYFQAVVLGALEAATEFLPVSSTGHLILAGHVLGFEGPPGRVFEVAIQLGAIGAIVVLYFAKLWSVLVGFLRGDSAARSFVLAVLLGFLPAMVLGAGLHGIIKGYLFNPTVVCVMLVLGGIAILAIERWVPMAQIYRVEDLGWRRALQIGCFQCVAMIPGVSRSGATIMGALLMGVERKVAAEYSFFLALPTMLGAVVFDLYKNRDVLAVGDLQLIAVGFVTAFVVALPVAKWFVGFVSSRGFAPFAYYRIVLGVLGLVGLYLM
ncbi:MAG: undecaprenyl-diphosphate phosphatase [Proteobacteria bacterium]|nr:undecaprenyl-diphosphate phosphatase [Pseudomonadota bacterium]